MNSIDIKVTRQQDEATVQVFGEIDITSAPSLEKEISALLEQGVRKLTLDLDGVSFMESTGLRVLLNVGTLLEENGELILYSPSEAVRRLLDVSGLISQFRVV